MSLRAVPPPRRLDCLPAQCPAPAVSVYVRAHNAKPDAAALTTAQMLDDRERWQPVGRQVPTRFSQQCCSRRSTRRSSSCLPIATTLQPRRSRPTSTRRAHSHLCLPRRSALITAACTHVGPSGGNPQKRRLCALRAAACCRIGKATPDPASLAPRPRAPALCARWIMQTPYRPMHGTKRSVLDPKLT